MYKGREIADYLDDIRTAIAEVEEFTCGMTFEAFAADKKTINAVIRSLEVLGPRAVEPHRHRKSPTVHRRYRLPQIFTCQTRPLRKEILLRAMCIPCRT